jgi:hypothetical protein
MPKQFWNLTGCLALVALLVSACQPNPPVTLTEGPAPTVTTTIVAPSTATSTPRSSNTPASPSPTTEPIPPTPTAEPSTSPVAFADSGQDLSRGSKDVALGDLDGDGALDLFFVNFDKSAEVWLSDGAGVFRDSGQRLGTSGISVSLGDLDGDGDLDAFVTRGTFSDDQPAAVWLNDGAGTFGEGQNPPGGTKAALGDLDGDGDLDVFAVHGDDRYPNRVLLNDGAGHFTDTGQNLGGRESLGVALGDLDGDGDLDAFITNWQQADAVLLNDGRGTFANTDQSLTPNNYDVTLGDLDGDGALDVFVTNASGEGNKVYLDDGAETLDDTGQRLGRARSHSVSLGDLDGDGDLDAFVANGGESGAPDEVWLNDGAGRFSDSGLRLGDAASEGMALGDVDGDGDLDAVVANVFGPNTLWVNETPRSTAAPLTRLTSDYLGQTPSGSTPVIFAPGVVSLAGKNNHTLSFSPDGTELFFTRDPDGVTMVMRREENGEWTEPRIAPFRGREAIFSPDGNRLYFNDGDIWFVERTPDGWSRLQSVGSPVNSSEHDYYASVTRDGTLYFSRIVAERARIFRSRLVDGQYSEVEELGPPINTSSHSYHPFIAPDESYLIFNSQRPGGYGGADLYISFRREDGTWSEPRNLGDTINSSDYDLCPIVSPDSEYFFFTRHRAGVGDVYWVDSGFIEQLRVEAE